MKFSVLILLFLTASVTIYAQDNSTGEREAYLKTITQRADKIVANLDLAAAAKKEKVRNIIRDQYDHLNDIYTARDLETAKLKEKYQDKKEREAALTQQNTEVMASLAKLHVKYLKTLGKLLTETKVEQVKDAMTYNVLPITYKAYQEQILTLTDVQKKQILTWLTEAREFAMDAESSDKKHAWFGKYKGRINNYLSAAGYDLKKEGVEWEKRRKAASKAE
jgi:hypothetical protein